MTPIEKRKAELREYIEAREQAVPGEWYPCGCRYTMISRDLNNQEIEDIVEVSNHYRDESQIEMNKQFICKAANESAKIAEQLLECIERWEKVADYSTCEELHPGCKKYKSYEDGWHGVAEYAKQTLNKIAGEK